MFKNFFSDELFKGTSIAMFIRFGAVVTSYFFTFIIAKFYGAQTLGAFAICQTILMIFSIFSRLGFDTASIKFISENNIESNFNKLKIIYFKILMVVVISSLFLNLVLFNLSEYIAIQIMGKPHIVSYIKVVSFGILPFSLLFLHSECFRGMKKILHYSLFRSMTIPFISSIFIIFFKFLNLESMQHPLYSYLITIILLSFIAMIFWISYLPISNDKIIVNVKLSSLLKVSLPMFFTSSLTYFLQWFSVLILGIFVSEKFVGMYDVAFRISMVTSISLFAVNSIVAPKIAELYSKNKSDEFRKLIHQSSKLIFFVSLPFIVLFISFPEFFLNIFGQEFVYAKSALMILTFGQFINSICGPVAWILQMTDKQTVFKNIILITTFINIILNFSLIPTYGIIGAAVSSCLGLIFLNVFCVIYIYKQFNIITVYGLNNFIKVK